MNFFKKIYSRTFQTVFKLMIPILPYHNPKVLNSVVEIPVVLKDKKINSVLIVTDKSIRDLGLIEPLEKVLKENKIRYTIYDKTVPNPTVSNVEEAREVYYKNACNALIGFGGGSSIDCAKAVGARVARPKKPISKMAGILQVLLPTPFLIAVPTTAGTGSEVTVTTVITDDKTHHKFSISDFPLIPDVAVLDPEVTRNLPKSLTATTGMDALTHAIEAYIGRSTVKSTRRDAILAVELISENLERAYSDGNNMEARANMLKAAFLAGRAFSKSYVGYIHAVAHSLGGKYNTPHGFANAVIMPYVLEMYGNSIHKKGKEIAVAMHIADKDIESGWATQMLIDKIRMMNKSMGIPSKISDIKEEDISILASNAAKEANPLYPVPILMDEAELEKIYYKVKEV